MLVGDLDALRWPHRQDEHRALLAGIPAREAWLKPPLMYSSTPTIRRG